MLTASSQGFAGAATAGALRGGAAHHPAVDSGDHVVALCGRNEFSGRHQHRRPRRTAHEQLVELGGCAIRLPATGTMGW